MLNSLRRRAEKVGLGISKERGEDYYMVYDLNTNMVIGGSYHIPYSLTLKDVEKIVKDCENA